MKRVLCPRTAFPAALLVGLASAGLVGPAPADELQTGVSARSLTIHSPEETLHRYCERDSDGRLWLQLPGAARFELVTSTADPAVSNPGDGAFHPFAESEVRAALAGMRYPLQPIRA